MRSWKMRSWKMGSWKKCEWNSRIALLAVVLPLLVGPTLRGVAAEKLEGEEVDLEALEKDRTQKGQKYKVNSRIKRYIAAAAGAVDEGDPEKAKKLLNKLTSNRLNPMERAVVNRMLAYVAYGQDDSEEAIHYFELTLQSEVMSIRDETKVRFYIAQLHASLQHWREVVTWLEQWELYVEEPDPLGLYLMGIAYYQLGDFQAAIEQSKRAIELSEKPREAWLRLLAALYSRSQDHENAAPVLEELVLRFPKKAYWVQLSLLYGANENYRRSLAVQQVAYAQNLLTEDKELRRLARSYLYHELPYPAARVLEEGLEAGSIDAKSGAFEQLANSWIAAREYERSIGPLRKAAALAADGNLYVRLGQVYMQSESWNEASGLLAQAIEKGGLKDPGNAELLLGIAYYNDSRIARARSSFLRAQKRDSTRDVASRWLTHLAAEDKASTG